jgi:hypothetical protein
MDEVKNNLKKKMMHTIFLKINKKLIKMKKKKENN